MEIKKYYLETESNTEHATLKEAMSVRGVKSPTIMRVWEVNGLHFHEVIRSTRINIPVRYADSILKRRVYNTFKII